MPKAKKKDKGDSPKTTMEKKKKTNEDKCGTQPSNYY